MAVSTQDGQTRTSLAEINMVPFIDIVLVLLIIFMITAPVIQSGLEVDVPGVEYVRELEEQKLVITIDRERRLYVQDEQINISDLGAKVAANMPAGAGQSVYLRSDESVPFGAIATVLDRLTQAGIEDVTIVTEAFEPGQP
jgi:biopolymer transport protein TolR